MASETDPLLPQGASAPEITGTGFSKELNANYQYTNKAPKNEVMNEETSEETSDQSFDQAETTASPLRTLFTLFSIVVLFALFITLLIPKGPGDRWHGPRDDPSTNPQTIEARVYKILSENPLIGLYISVYLFTNYIT